MKKKIKTGYKAFNKDLTCLKFKYEIGKTYSIDVPLKLCSSGFHFCENLKDVYNYYTPNEKTRICKIKALGKIITENDKSCTDKIEILEEIHLDQVKSLTDNFKFNSGNRNSGHYNSGNRNSGNRNSGYGNSGHYNSGYGNSGDWNSGNRNSGDRNSGNRNSGYGNSGNRNSGHYNSGDWNSGNRNSGYFNTTTPKVRLFNFDSNLDFNDLRITKITSILNNYWKPVLEWIDKSRMSKKEIKDNPSCETTGGYLKFDKDNSYKKSWKNVWTKCTKEEKKCFTDLPNFDAKVFEDITGIKV